MYNGKELNSDFDLNWQYYGFRMYDAAIGRFPSVDPIADQFAHVSPFNYAENMVPMAIDLWGLQAVLVHGTNSDKDTWTQNEKQISVLKELSGNKTVLSDFEWPEGTNGLSHQEEDRTKAANALASYVLDNLADGEDLTLIGHSHGGNVAIQAVDIIRAGLKEGDDRKIRLITLATPAYNGGNDIENPKNTSVDAHLHFFSTGDDVQVELANFKGNKAGSRRYGNINTQQFEIEDYSQKNHWLLGKRKTHNHRGVESHYIHKNIQYIKKIIEKGTINYSDWQ